MKIVTDDTFAVHDGFDLAAYGDKNWPASDLPTFRVLKQEEYETFKARVAQRFKLNEAQIRLWVLVNRQNRTKHLTHQYRRTTRRLVFKTAERKSWFLTSYAGMEIIRNVMAVRTAELCLYLDVVVDDPSGTVSPFLIHLTRMLTQHLVCTE